MTRVDLHLHSRASTRTGNWFLNSAGLPESYTDPAGAYRAARERGMDFVTLTDHDTIDGALEIAHQPGAFVSVEATTWFTDDGTPLHVLCWDIDEDDFADIDRAREDVHQLVGVLRARDITHALAHPLQRIGARLTADHLERCLLLFAVWEGRNGARSRAGNETAVRIAGAASPAYLAKLADKHGIEPAGSGPPALTAGSDDHGLIDAAATWTCTPAADDVATLLGHVRAGRTELGGAHGSTAALAHAMVGLAIKAATDRGHCPIPVDYRGVASKILQHPLPGADDAPAAPKAMRGDARVRGDFLRISSMPRSAARSHAAYRAATDWAQAEILRRALSGADAPGGLTGIMQRLSTALGGLALSAPYVAASGYHAAEARHANGVARAFFGDPQRDADGPVRALVFTDTFDQVNGVAGMMRRLADRSGPLGLGTTVVAFGDAPVDTPSLARLRPLAELPMPAYSDDALPLGIPSIAQVIDLLEQRDAQVVHAATLGPLGLAGILAARILGIPVITGHSTQLARYTLMLTGDRLAAEAVRVGSAWLHRQSARVLVPSTAIAEGLAGEGISADRIRLVSRGVDTDLFGPDRAGFRGRRLLGGDGGPVVICVSRLSDEKGLDRLLDAMDVLRHPTARLVLVGDGPMRDRLANRMAGTRHRLAGALEGRRLAAAYASADVFCLPSLTETFGQVALEAQASGIPVVVVRGTAVAENVIDGVTGMHAASDDPRHLAAAIGALADNEVMRQEMGEAARRQMVSRANWDDVFRALAVEYSEVAEAASAVEVRERLPVELGVL